MAISIVMSFVGRAWLMANISRQFMYGMFYMLMNEKTSPSIFENIPWTDDIESSRTKIRSVSKVRIFHLPKKSKSRTSWNLVQDSWSYFHNIKSDKTSKPKGSLVVLFPGSPLLLPKKKQVGKVICSLGKRGGVHLETFKSERNSQLFFTVEVLVFYFSDQFRVNKNTTKLHGDICQCHPKNANDQTYLSQKKWSLTKRASSRNRGWESPSLCHEPSEFECRCHFEANAIVSIPCATFPVGGFHFATSNVTSCSPNIIVGECKRIPPFWLAVLSDTKRILCLDVKVHLRLLAFWLL